MRNEYIYERKGKKGITLQVKVPCGSGKDRFFQTASFKVSDYPSKTAAYQAARMQRDIYIVNSRNMPKKPQSASVGALYSHYLEMSALSLNTMKYYKPIYRDVCSKYVDIDIQKITAFDIQSSLTEYAQGHSQKMVSRAVTVWHNIFRTAQMKGIDVSDKTQMLMPVCSRYTSKRRKKDVISFEQFKSFTQFFLSRDGKRKQTKKKDQDIWYMLWLMYYTGCRPAEALAINSEDIDFENNLLHIVKSVGSSRTELRQILTTKRPASYRHFPITEELETLLHSLVDYSNSSPLLCDSDGLPYNIATIDDRITQAKIKTGIQFNLYQCRHMFSDAMFDIGTSPVVVRDLMGHESSSMSLDYAKASRDQMTAAVKKRSGNNSGTN